MKLELLKRGPCGVAACNIEVAKWNGLPPFDPTDADLLVAAQHSGECRRCDQYVQTERLRQGLGADDAVVANFIDPNIWILYRCSRRMSWLRFRAGDVNGVDVRGAGTHAGALRHRARDWAHQGAQ